MEVFRSHEHKNQGIWKIEIHDFQGNLLALALITLKAYSMR